MLAFSKEGILSPLALEPHHPYDQLWKRKITGIRTSDGDKFLRICQLQAARTTRRTSLRGIITQSMEFWQNYHESRLSGLIFCDQTQSLGASWLLRRRKWVRLSLRCTVLPNFSPHCIYTTSSVRVAHAAKLQSQQPFRTKFIMSEKENCVQKSAEMFYTLISSFERIFPRNDQVWGCFLCFLTLNKSFGGWSPVCCSQQPSFLLT